MKFETITLREMDRVALMDRRDVKFVFRSDQLPQLLMELSEDYFVLDVAGNRISRYESLYFDTKGFDLYFAHHRKKPTRFKIRYRTYVESHLHFFEIKFKNNKGRTFKDRIIQTAVDGKIDNLAENLLKEKTPISAEVLEPKFWVNYSRITLVNKWATERVTIDLNLTFKNDEQQKVIDALVIAEVKQDKIVSSKFIEIMKRNHLREIAISKYCYGVINLHNTLKHNNFNRNLRSLKKAMHVTFTNS